MTPTAVRLARALWFLAIGAGALETVLVVAAGRAGDGALLGVAVRAAVFAAAAVVTLRMAAGRRWARVALALGLGLLGTLSLTVAPALWLLEGHSPAAALRSAGPVDLAFGAVRGLHVAAVLGACALMFAPSANAYFRRPAGRAVPRLR